MLVNQFLEVGGPNLLEVGDAEDEADRVEDVGFSRPVEARDGVEEGVEAGDDGSGRVGLESFESDLFDVHFLGFFLGFWDEREKRAGGLRDENPRVGREGVREREIE